MADYTFDLFASGAIAYSIRLAADGLRVRSTPQRVDCAFDPLARGPVARSIRCIADGLRVCAG
jgi:hypothetical protein